MRFPHHALRGRLLTAYRRHHRIFAKGALHCAERILFKHLWDLFQAGDVILADSGFCSYADFFFLKERGIDCVMRNLSRRSAGIQAYKQLTPGDRLVYWTKMRPCPTWLSKEQWANVPEKLLVREVKFAVVIRGCRTKNIGISTTLLDHETYSKDDLADLYRRRWRAELFLRDIKITMGMDILRCKTPEMIHKELCMYLIAYNLVRALMWQTAVNHGVTINRLSFKGAVTTLISWAPLTAARILSQHQWNNRLSALILLIAKDLNLQRPNRQEPRAKKRRAKNYQLLNKPRKQFQEIQHRNKYSCNLS